MLPLSHHSLAKSPRNSSSQYLFYLIRPLELTSQYALSYTSIFAAVFLERTEIQLQGGSRIEMGVYLYSNSRYVSSIPSNVGLEKEPRNWLCVACEASGPIPLTADSEKLVLHLFFFLMLGWQEQSCDESGYSTHWYPPPEHFCLIWPDEAQNL